MSTQESWTIICDQCTATISLPGTLFGAKIKARSLGWRITPDACPDCVKDQWNLS